MTSYFFQILTGAKEYTTSKRNGCVKLRKEDSGLGSEEPISVPTLLQDAAAAYPDVSHHLCLFVFLIWASGRYCTLRPACFLLAYPTWRLAQKCTESFIISLSTPISRAQNDLYTQRNTYNIAIGHGWVQTFKTSF